MSQPVVITSTGNKTEAIVTSRGELVTGKASYSTPYYMKVAVANTTYQIVPGIAGKQFVITDMLLATDKTFATSTAGEPIHIYGAHPADLSTAIDTIVLMELLKNDRLVSNGLNLITDVACAIVAIATTSAAVDVTIAGYYVDA